MVRPFSFLQYVFVCAETTSKAENSRCAASRVFRKNGEMLTAKMKSPAPSPAGSFSGEATGGGWADVRLAQDDVLRQDARSGKLDRARSRLYQSQILQENMRWKALAEIYTMPSFAPFWNRIPKTKKTMGAKRTPLHRSQCSKVS